MLRYILKRLLAMIPVILGVVSIVFIITALTPGDPARQMLGVSATQEQVDTLRHDLGLDKPIANRYLSYLRDLLKGDMGKSYVTKSPVLQEIITRFPTTLKLAFLSMLFATIIGIPLGIISALRRYSWIDTLTTSFAMICVSIPEFLFGILLMLLFSVRLHWLPAVGLKTAANWIMPVAALSIGSVASISRTTRSSMLESMNMDCIRTARAKGQREVVVIFKHMLGNAMIPILTVIISCFSVMLGGVVLIESVFAIGGLGRYMVTSIMANDYPVVQGSVLYLSVVFSIISLLLDLMYVFVDPRIKSTFVAVKKKRNPSKTAANEEVA